MKRPAKERRDPLAKDGPIANRARGALRTVAAQFGEVTSADATTVTVRTTDTLSLTLGYDLGNYVFSRVYNLTIAADLPDSALPSGLTLSHRGPSGTRYVAAGGAHTGRALSDLNAAVREQLGRIDLLSSSITGPSGSRTLTLTPLGGSYVWVLIPPVFKATAFPAGEPARLLDLVRTIRALTPHHVSSERTTP